MIRKMIKKMIRKMIRKTKNKLTEILDFNYALSSLMIFNFVNLVID